ncbi:hypothetical protein BCBD1442_25020 [Brucella ceti]|nr:hypothetical protein BCBD1442_25020 [Brucella ceti]
MRMTALAVSTRKAACPSQVIFMYISFGLDFWCVNRYDADKVESNMQAVEKSDEDQWQPLK